MSCSERSNHKKRLSVADLNDRVQGFPCGFSEIKNRPPVITEDQIKSGNLRMTASECASQGTLG